MLATSLSRMMVTMILLSSIMGCVSPSADFDERVKEDDLLVVEAIFDAQGSDGCGVEKSTTITKSITNQLPRLNALRKQNDPAIVRKTYEQFFAQHTSSPSDTANSRDYADHAYRFHEILVASDDYKQAADMLRLALKADLQGHVRRRVLVELAEIEVYLARHSSGEERTRHLKEAEDICKSILW